MELPFKNKQLPYPKRFQCHHLPSIPHFHQLAKHMFAAMALQVA
jgi:hypothetical protein